MRKIVSMSLMIVLLICTVGCNNVSEKDTSLENQIEYGVYLSDTYEQLPDNVSCETIVIDAQYYSEDEIAALKENNGTVLSYLNIGSIEEFRDYYKDYDSLILGPYENWEEEYWINVADESWQEFVVDDLARTLINKGIDGFFIDNTDVYYNYPEQEIFDGITTILEALKAKNMLVYINGGDTYVSTYLMENGNLDSVLDGVNQESVFTSINWESNSFELNDDDTKQYYLDYLSAVYADGKQVFLLEYTNDSDVAALAKTEGSKLGYKVYVSDSIELD